MNTSKFEILVPLSQNALWWKEKKGLTWLAMDPRDPASENLLCIFAVSLIFFFFSFFFFGGGGAGGWLVCKEQYNMLVCKINNICESRKERKFLFAKQTCPWNGKIWSMMESKAFPKWKIVVSFYNFKNIYIQNENMLIAANKMKWNVSVWIRNIRCQSFWFEFEWAFGKNDSLIIILCWIHSSNGIYGYFITLSLR